MELTRCDRLLAGNIRCRSPGAPGMPAFETRKRQIGRRTAVAALDIVSALAGNADDPKSLLRQRFKGLQGHMKRVT